MPNASHASTSNVFKAAFAISKAEREELFTARKRLIAMTNLLKSKGFSVDEELQDVGYFAKPPGRDEMGLQILKKGRNPFVDKMKNKVQDDKDIVDNADQVFEKKIEPNKADKVFEEKTEPNKALAVSVQKPDTSGDPGADPFVDKLKGSLDEDKRSKAKNDSGSQAQTKKSWASVLKSETTEVNFKYYPLGKDTSVVQPPDEVLKMGNEKFHNCVVGSFIKGTQSYKNVSEFAFKNWGSRGQLNEFQKDPNTYIFKFDGELNKDAVLSRGTWYIGRKPMVVNAWGVKSGVHTLSATPLWIKISNILDSYWTEERLSRLASVVGKPLRVDAMTSKLDIMPYARILVLYFLGDPLPN